MSQIKSCPFCGHVGLDFSDGSTYRWGVASCQGCGATAGETRREYPDQGKWHETAISEWNKRQAITTEESSEVQEPVAKAWDEGYQAGVNDERISDANIGIAGFNAKVEPARNNPYRTHPQPKAEQEPKREPLTDEQIDEATQKWAGHSMVSLERLIMCREYARAIESAHGIKGGA